MVLSTNRLFKKIDSSDKIKIEGSLLIKLQQTLLEMLNDFASVCDKYGFYYSLCGGTALGAVRHEGFIPWDDDIDVFMHRKDLKKFYSIFDKELSNKYYLHSMERTPELGIPMMRMMKKNTVYVVDDTLDCQERGVFIDICVLENAPDNWLLRRIHGIGSLYYGLCVSCSRFYRKKSIYLNQFDSAPIEVKKTIKRKAMIGKLISWRSLTQWIKKYNNWNAKYQNHNDSRYVVCPTGTKHYFGEIFPRKIYMETRIIKFENSEFRIIKNYDWALKRLYGNYMSIPPKSKRETHYVLDVKI